MSQNQESEPSRTPEEEQVLNYNRLWVGNLDPRISEYQLLKLMQKHGTIEKFDLLFHRTGPLAGQPRGYAFITFKNKEDAVAAKKNLHDTMVGTKKVIVTWAHSINSDEVEKPKPEIKIPALAMSKPETKTNREIQIQAIEAKLKLMEHHTSDELVINKTVATELPVITQFQFNKESPSTGGCKTRNAPKRSDRFSKPYRKHRGRR